MAIVEIGSKFVGEGYPAFVIGEIGINHNGNVEIAKKLIDIAAKAGCDAVKFQKRTVDVVYTPEELARLRENPFGSTNGDLKRGLGFGQKEYEEIDRYCKEVGIQWFASPWDIASVDFLEQFNPPCYKIASASITDRKLLEYVRSKGRPVIMSTGMSTIHQIREAVRTLGERDLVLMHCIATYPTPDDELHLGVIRTLQKEFPNVPIGYSGHGYGTTMTVCAAAMGACVIERHISIDRTMWGTDQAASLEPGGLALMVSNIRRFERAYGDGIKKVLPSEVPIVQKLRRIQDF